VDGERTTRSGYGDALAFREFRALFIAQLVSITGTAIAAVALTVVVYRRTGSPFLSSITFALGFLPYLLGGGLLSSVVDRVRPRRLVASCDLSAGFLGAGMAWPAMPIPGLLALLFGIGLVSAVAAGARVALVRSSVSDDAYVPARSLMRIVSQVAQIGGNAFGGTLLVLLTPSGALLANAASFAVSAALVRLFLENHPSGRELRQASLLRDSLRGARTILAHGELRPLLLVAWVVPMFAVAPEAVGAPYVAAHHGSPALVGWWLAALPIGLICGNVIGIRGLSPEQQRRIVVPAATASFVPYLAFVLDPPVPIALPLLLLGGACSLYSLGLDARVRDAAPPHLFARTMSLNTAGLTALQGAGFAFAGAVAQAVGPALAIAAAGGCGVVVANALLRGDRTFVATRDWVSGIMQQRPRGG
jgi:MFS family permease